MSEMKSPTFKNLSLELLADAMFQGEERQSLMKGTMLAPIPKDLLSKWREILAKKEKEIGDIKAVIAFSEVAALVSPGEIEIDFHDDE